MGTRALFLLWMGIALCAVLWSEAHASVNVTVNGSTYVIPQKNEKGWGDNVTSWIQAISANTVQPSGGTFTLTADLDFGASFGVKGAYFKSRSSNISSAGLLRLAVGDSLGWRNNANSGNLLLAVNGSDQLTFNGVLIPSLTSSSFVDSGFSINSAGDNTKKIAFSAAGITTANTRTITVPDANVDLGNLTNSNISGSAAIARSKIATGSINQVIINDGSTGLLSSEAQLASTRGGSGVNNAGTLTWGSSSLSFSTSGATSITLPTAGTMQTIAGSESPTNKTFNNTNTYTTKDGSFTLQSTGDTTKQLVYSLASIPTATTITVTEPSASYTPVGVALAQTLTSKTLTSPTLTTPTVDIPNFTQQTTPANPSASNNKLYFKSDNHLYSLTSAGTEVQVDNAATAVTYDTPMLAYNTGLAATVASNALTIRLKQKDGATDPGNTLTTKVSVAFRNVTSATGAYASVDQTTALSIVVPSSATLGQASAVNQYVWVYLISDSGLDMCVSGVNVFDDLSVQSATAITSGSTSGTTLYCGSAHTSKPVRLIGRMLVNETTAGTWASAPTELGLMPVPKYSVTEWATYTPTFTSIGSPTSINYWWRRVGGDMEVRGTHLNGTAAATLWSMTLPGAFAIDTTRVAPSNNTTAAAGMMVGMMESNAGTAGLYNIVLAPGTSTTLVYDASTLSGTTTLVPQSTNGGITAGALASISFKIPILGWSSYGP